MRSVWIAGLMLAFGGSASGAEAVDCANAMSTYEMNACADKDLAADDAALNAAYAKALADIAKHNAPAPYDRKTYEQALRMAQRAWIAYRDADCKGVVPMAWGGGTGTTLAVLGCLSAKTQTRTKELTEMFEGR